MNTRVTLAQHSAAVSYFYINTRITTNRAERVDKREGGGGGKHLKIEYD